MKSIFSGGFFAVRYFAIPDNLERSSDNIKIVTAGLSKAVRRFLEGGRRTLGLGVWCDESFRELPRDLRGLLEAIVKEQIETLLVRGYGDADTADGYLLDISGYFSFCRFEENPSFRAAALSIIVDTPPLTAAGACEPVGS